MIVGEFSDSAPFAPSPVYGGLKGRFGSIAAFNISEYHQMTPTGINDLGVMSGVYSGGGAIIRGSQVTPVNYPGASSTYVSGINQRGWVVGSYYLPGGPYVQHGFVYAYGTYTPLDVSGATGTSPSGVNDGGTVIGTYYDASGVAHGFRYAAGANQTLDVPDAAITLAFDINDLGHFVAFYSDATGNHGFLNCNGTIITFHAP